MIEFRDVWKSFGGHPVLQGIDLRIEPGERFFILGQTGVGKTVLIRLLVGLLRADRGQVWVDGEKVTAFSEAQFMSVRRKCGMVFQFPTLFDSLTVFENLAFALRRHTDLSEEEIAAQVRENLALVHLPGDVAERMPQELSYGMQKRVGLARTIALRPRILLYDEPTTGLDPFTAEQINRLMLEMAEKLSVTSVVVSHDLISMVRVADRVTLLADGRLVEVSRPEQFLHSANPLVRQFVEGRAAPEAAP
ncbi:MAG: ABC transporter ATP-binding protein [Deltaproteobacteria bacterium RBG_13_61_14]|nr:MAG: ABC transporter ATP-binding protein [Deltaproteobacteria bacterium RBG_13_61_14]